MTKLGFFSLFLNQSQDTVLMKSDTFTERKKVPVW